MALAQEIKTENKSTVEQIVNWYEKNLNYGTITLLMAIESSFIPFPSEVVVPPAAYKAIEKPDKLNIILVVIFATLGAIIGSIINYYLAKWLGRPIIYKFAESKIGKMCLLNKEKIENAEKYFIKHGKASTFIGRLVPAVRQLISIPAGLAKMNIGTFILFTSLGALIWNVILAFLGYLAHGQKDLIDKYSSEISYVLLALGILFVLYLLYKSFSKRKS
ncbi:MAG: DedA family protein [Bacteroidales bacterium]|nr:DedA family protein [Bacteroidales bacterium]